jgi:hypothetical protein
VNRDVSLCSPNQTMKIKHCLFAIALMIWSAGVCLAAAAPVVSQVHVVSVHVRDRAAFDAVFLFLRDDLQLPRVYGEVSNPGNDTQRLYAGFSVGNAYLEPCGPYQSDPPYLPDQPARFVGLTFSPGASMEAEVKELRSRNLTFSGPFGVGDGPLYVYLSDPRLTGKMLSTSLWEIRNKEDRAHLRFLQTALEEAKGGALGVQQMAEVRIAYPEAVGSAWWSSLLQPARQVDEAWVLGSGPRLRIVPAKEPHIQSILLKVGSLEKAKAFLAAKSLLGTQTTGVIELDPAKTSGLRIQLQEQ